MKLIAISELTRANLLFMRTALIMLALNIVVSLGLYFSSAAFKQYRHGHQIQAQQRLDIAQRDQAKISSEQEDIRRYLSPYQTLHADYRLDEERRLDWIDALSRIRDQRNFYPVEYDIASIRPYPLTGLPSAQALKASASRMNIKLSLLHDNDILILLNDLQARKVGLFTIDYCDISRKVQEPSGHLQLVQHLMAECTLDWLTLENPASPSSPAGSSR